MEFEALLIIGVRDARYTRMGELPNQGSYIYMELRATPWA